MTVNEALAIPFPPTSLVATKAWGPRMASGEMVVPKLHDDDLVFAIRDINPRAPVHLLIIPKEHIVDAYVGAGRSIYTDAA